MDPSSVLRNGLEYLKGRYGILSPGQYQASFILSLNPAIITLMEPRHLALLTIGTILSLANHRAILPFVTIILLDLNLKGMTGETKAAMALSALAGFAIIAVYGAGTNAPA